jgi:hypothetical protein
MHLRAATDVGALLEVVPQSTVDLDYAFGIDGRLRALKGASSTMLGVLPAGAFHQYGIRPATVAVRGTEFEIRRPVILMRSGRRPRLALVRERVGRTGSYRIESVQDLGPSPWTPFSQL